MNKKKEIKTAIGDYMCCIIEKPHKMLSISSLYWENAYQFSSL